MQQLVQQVQQLLETATLATGGDPGRIGSHSLRIGGATAMFATRKYTDDEVRRFGRWLSDCFCSACSGVRKACSSRSPPSV